MTSRPHLSVLIVEDNPGDAYLIREMLSGAEGPLFRAEVAGSLAEGLEWLAADGADAVLLDLSLPDSRGLDSFRRVHESAPEVPVVVLSGHEDEELAARAVHEGAQDYLVKGQVDAALLGRSLRYAVERQRIEEELRRRAEELRQADRRKDEFLAILAHELRAPLPSILAAVEVLGTEETEVEATGWARETVRRQVGNLARLLEDLLDVSRIVHGKIRIEKEPVRLEEIVRAAADTVAPVLRRRDLGLSLSMPDGTWLEADPTRLEQVLVNLLHNAAAYSDPGGRIWLEAAVDREDALIRVRDQGAGMEPEFVGRVFEPFSQAGGTRDRSGSGLGLGLALVRDLVELHGGTVSARSEGLGRGSEFEVRLPAAAVAGAEARPATGGPESAAAGVRAAAVEPRAAAVPAPEAADPASRADPASKGERPVASADERRRLRVLVVDDNRDTAEGMALILDRWGHEVMVAYDGPTALELARECRPEVVLLDIGLPGMDGYAVARSLRSDPTTAESILWAITGYGRAEDERRSLDAGFERHLKKPVPTPRLRRLLEEVATAQSSS